MSKLRPRNVRISATNYIPQSRGRVHVLTLNPPLDIYLIPSIYRYLLLLMWQMLMKVPGRPPSSSLRSFNNNATKQHTGANYDVE